MAEICLKLMMQDDDKSVQSTSYLLHLGSFEKGGCKQEGDESLNATMHNFSLLLEPNEPSLKAASLLSTSNDTLTAGK